MSLKSIVIPCYNEAESLPALLADFEALSGGEQVDWELLLVDNGSTDRTAAVLARELKLPGRHFARVVSVPPPNIGYGHGIMTGLNAANGDLLAWTHADGQAAPADVLRAFETLLSAPTPRRTFVKGRRRGQPLHDVLISVGMQAMAAVVLGAPLEDIAAQPKAFHRDLLARVKVPPVDFTLDLYFFWLARSAGYEIRTIDVATGARERVVSKSALGWKGKARDLARTVKFMNAVRRGAGYPAFRV